MLADPRATDALVDDFAAQWLNLRRVDEVVVDPERYPNFDESLLQAFKQETELFVGSTLREDRSVAGSAERRLHVRQRAAGAALRHSGHLRQPLPPRRRCRTPISAAGCSAQGALLATTSYPDRTSPVLRGKWLLNNIFGSAGAAAAARRRHQPRRRPSRARRRRSIRERLAQHRHESRRAQLPFGRSIRSGSRSRTSTRSAAGGPSTNRASRSTPAARR